MKKKLQMKILTVSQVNQYASRLMAQDPLLGSLKVEGEISGGKIYSSGHYYFSLKDSKAKIDCVFFRGGMSALKFKPTDGQHVVISGQASIYEAGGRFQIVVHKMEQAGEGVLYLQFLELKERLTGEGLFSAEKKKPLPYLPRKIGVITSSEGAVIRDIIHILRRRHPGFKLLIYPVAVQGPNSSAEIVAAFKSANRFPKTDVLILCRGGGSMEDLISFNSEEVARAIFASKIPVISAVGHETDYSISDFVADMRAPTPSAAAELVLPAKEDLFGQIRYLKEKISRTAELKLKLAQNKLANLLDKKILRQPESLLYAKAQQLDSLNLRLKSSFNLLQANLPHRFELIRARFLQAIFTYREDNCRQLETICRRIEQSSQNRYARLRLDFEKQKIQLKALDPNAVIKRGYARISSLETDRLISSIRQLEEGMKVKIHLADGRAESQIIGLEDFALKEN